LFEVDVAGDAPPPPKFQEYEYPAPLDPVLVKLKELPARHWLADCVKVDVGCGFTVME
jgi:hypothetical protein